MISVTIFEDIANPQGERHEVDSLLPFLAERFPDGWPGNARIYHNHVSRNHDVTPATEDGVTRLAALEGDFYVVFYPQADPWTWGAIIVAVVIAVAAAAAAFLIKPKAPSIAPNSTTRNVQNVSANNELSQRVNKARPGGRIPDIFGTVRSTPDLIVSPYSEYVDNREVEHSVLVIGRGVYEIHDLYDGETQARYVPDTSVQVYRPYTDIISGSPYYTVGPPIATDPMLSIRSNSVNGQTLKAPNANTYNGGSNVVFAAPDMLYLSSGADNTLSDRFTSGDEIVISNSASGDNDLNLDGTYRMASVVGNTIYLDSPAEVNANWSGLEGNTGASSARLSSTGEGWIGWFTLEDADLTEFWANIIAMNGLYKDNGTTQYAVTVEVLFQVKPVDKNDQDIGKVEEFTVSLTGSTVDRNTVAKTLKAAPKRFKGRCMVRARRLTNTDKGFQGSVVDEVQWRDLYAMAPLPSAEFGNVTVIRSATVATTGALALKERKLNCLVTRQIPVRGEDGAFTESLHSTNNIADIVCAAALDEFIGRRSPEELDLDSIYMAAAEVEEYFGTPLCAEFCYTFDNENTSGEESLTMIAGAGFCTPYRLGNRIKLFFERTEDLSALLFNHRNKIPGSETRTLSFGYANDEDGIEYEYVSPEDDAIVTLRIPEDGSAINPRKIESIGVRNNVQAHMHSWRAWMRSLHQRLSVEFEATMEADILIPGRRVLVADNIRGEVMDGQVESQQGLEVFTSRPLNMEASYVNEWGLIKPKPYYCFLQLADGTVQSMPVYKGGSFNSFILSEAPAVPLVMDDAAYAKTTFAIVEDRADEALMAFLVEEKEPADNFTVGLTCVNYDARYYARDKDFITGAVRVKGV